MHHIRYPIGCGFAALYLLFVAYSVWAWTTCVPGMFDLCNLALAFPALPWTANVDIAPLTTQTIGFLVAAYLANTIVVYIIGALAGALLRAIRRLSTPLEEREG